MEDLKKNVLDESLEFKDFDEKWWRKKIFKEFLKDFACRPIKKRKYAAIVAKFINFDSSQTHKKIFRKGKFMKFLALAKEEQYDLMRSAQDRYYREMGNLDALTYEVMHGKFFIRRVFYEDHFYRDRVNNKRFKLPFYRGAFLNENCSICLEDFTEKIFVCELECRHCYHFECLDKWLALKTCCPICQMRISTTMQVTNSEFEWTTNEDGARVLILRVGVATNYF